MIPTGPGPVPDHRGLTPSPTSHRPGVGAAVALVLLGVLAVVALGVVAFLVGPAAFPGATVLALLPLAAVMATVLWVDRWEPEPWQALGVAFGWGASVAVLVALVLNSGAQAALLAVGVPPVQAQAWAAVAVAPVVEESVKALGVLVIFLTWRRWFDGPVDGVVYAATVAAGFAFVENVLYFGTAIGPSPVGADAAGAVATVFVLRAVLSPFAHVLFTVCVGLALGAAARHGRAWVVALPTGLVVAVVLHALWNGSATLVTEQGFWGVYVSVQVPVFLGMVGLVLWLRGREAAVLRRRLGEYAGVGWFTPQEVAMLSSVGERRRALRWSAARGGPAARRSMRELQVLASRLAFQRQRVALDRADLRGRHDETAMLARLGQVRAELRHRLQV